MKSLCILGRQPGLSLAELESLFGADAILPVSDEAALLDVAHAEVDFSRLGGTIKFCKPLTILDTTSWKDIEKFLVENVPKHAATLPEGKLQLGLSAYGLGVTGQTVGKTGLSIKKALRASGRSSRVIPNNEPALNSAQVLHNRLTAKMGWELLLVKHGTQTICAQTIAVQDIDAYAARDQNRPKRDSRVGMLPPKLAQTIINLAGAQPAETVWDPFCGTGVLMQEALLMGLSGVGSDIDERMVAYSKENLAWLGEHKPNYCSDKQFLSYRVEKADATTVQFNPIPKFIASETYLGRPFASEPDEATLKQVIQDVNTIHKKFFENVERQTASGFRLCLAVPAWHVRNHVLHLPILDQLQELGYNRVSFVHAKNESLIYRRPDQVVGRELVTLIRK